MELKKEMMDIWSKVEDVVEKIKELTVDDYSNIEADTRREWLKNVDEFSCKIREDVKELCRRYDIIKELSYD